MDNIEEILGGCDEFNKLRFEKDFCRKLRESTQPRAIPRAVLGRWEYNALRQAKNKKGWRVPGKKIGAGEADLELGADGETVEGEEKAG